MRGWRIVRISTRLTLGLLLLGVSLSILALRLRGVWGIIVPWWVIIFIDGTLTRSPLDVAWDGPSAGSILSRWRRGGISRVIDIDWIAVQSSSQRLSFIESWKTLFGLLSSLSICLSLDSVHTHLFCIGRTTTDTNTITTATTTTVITTVITTIVTSIRGLPLTPVLGVRRPVRYTTSAYGVEAPTEEEEDPGSEG
jgi:hypothetical protein